MSGFSREHYRRIFSLAWGAFLNTILVSSFSIIDTAMVGKLGAYAIAAVGLVKQPLLLMNLALIGFTAATTTMVAQRKGAGDEAGANQVLWQSMEISGIISLAVLVPAMLFAEPIVTFMGANSDTLQAGVVYFRCVMASYVFTALGNAITAGLQGAGKLSCIVFVTVISNAVNILFNYLLIYGKWGFPQLSVMGAGIATALSNLAALLVLVLMLLSGKQYLSFSGFRLPKMRVCEIKEYIGLGLPVAFRRSATRIGMLVMVKLVAPMGTAVMAAYQIVFQLHNVSFWCGEAIGTAVTSLAGQSKGAKKEKEAYNYIITSVFIGIAISVCTGLLFIGYPTPALHIFTKDVDVISASRIALVIVALFQPFQCAGVVIAGGLAGLGNTRTYAVATSIGIVALRPLIAYALTQVLHLGIMGIWIAIAADEIFRFVYVFAGFRRQKRETEHI